MLRSGFVPEHIITILEQLSGFTIVVVVNEETPPGCREVGKRIKDWKSRGSIDAPAYVKGVVRPRR